MDRIAIEGLIKHLQNYYVEIRKIEKQHREGTVTDEDWKDYRELFEACRTIACGLQPYDSVVREILNVGVKPLSDEPLNLYDFIIGLRRGV